MSSRRGVALLLTLIAVAVAATLAYSFLASQATSMGISRNVDNHARARHVAESGLEMVKAYILSNENWRSEKSDGTWVSDESFEDGSYTVVAEDGWDNDGDGVIDGDGDLSDDSSDPVTLTATGTFDDATHVVQVVLTPTSGACSGPGIVVSDSIEVTNGVGYSDAGRIVPLSSGASVATNSTSVGKIAVSEGGSISTDVYIGAGGNPAAEPGNVVTEGTDGLVDGVIDALESEISIPTVTQPSGLGDSSGDVSLSAGVTTWSSDGHFGELIVGGTAELEIIGDVTVLCEGPVEFSGDAKLIVDSGSTLTLYVKDSVEFLNQCSINFGAADYRKFKVKSLATGSSAYVRSSGTSRIFAQVEGQECELQVAGNSHFHGTFMGESVLVKDEGWLHVGCRSSGGATTSVPSPVLHYSFDSQSGTTIDDRVGNVDLAMIAGNGSIDWVTDAQAGTGVYFNQDAQSGTAIARTTSTSTADDLKSALQDSDALTVQIFLKAEGFDNSYGRMLSYSRDTGSTTRNLTMAADNDGASTADLIGRVKNSSSTTEYKQDNLFNTNQLHVLAFTVDLAASSDNVNLYVDGQLVKSSSASGSFDSWTSEHFMLGNELTTDRPYRGYMYDVKIWDSALSAEQLLYNASKFLPSDDGTPNLIALYEFNEVPVPDPELVAHWKLDEATGSSSSGPTGFSLINNVDYGGSNAVIDTYRSSLGPYSATNSSANAVVTVNAVGSNRITLYSGGVLKGDALIGPGGDPSAGIQTWGGSQITGERGTLTSVVEMPVLTAPTGEPFDSSNEGNLTAGGGQVITINSDRHINKLQAWSNGKFQIDGNVTMLCDGNIAFNTGNALEILPDSSLDLYVKGGIDIGGKMNANTAEPGRLRIYMLGSGKNVDMWGSAEIHACVQNPTGNLAVWNTTKFFGTYIGKKYEGNGGVHIDLDCVSGGGGGGGGTTAAEEVAGNDGTYTGGVVGGEEGFGGGGTSVRFDGSDDYVLIPHSDAYLLNRGAVSFWFKPEGMSGHRAMFSKDSSNYDTGGHLHIYTYGSSVRVRLQSTSAEYTLASGSGVSTGQWHHVVFDFGTGGMKLYLDGNLVDSDSYTGGLGTSSGGVGNKEPLVLGAGTWGSGDLTHLPISYPYTGLIDDVRIYDYPLDNGQVADLYGGGEVGSGSGVGSVVQDTSEYSTALDLTIDDTSKINWVAGGGLEFVSATKAVSSGAASKLYTALTDTDEMTLEVKFSVANLTQSGPARIVSYSSGTSYRNFTFGQEERTYVQRLRTTSVSDNGVPNISSSDVLTTGDIHHVIVTYKDGVVSMYRNGTLEVTESRSGTFDWNSGYSFVLANETSSDRAWLGTLYRVAIYDRGLTAGQVEDVFDGEAPGLDEGGGYGFDVDWDEGL